jgi:undecaprenyl-diphosphatase
MGIAAIDDSTTAWVNGLSGRSSALDLSMVALTTYGAFAIVAAVAIRWWWTGAADKMRERYLAVVSGASVTLGLALNQVVLLGVHRARPYDAGVSHLIVAASKDPSFPSDHATLAFAVAFALLGAGARRGWAFLIAAALLSFSRIYVGTHYLSDIMGGALTGAVAAIVCLALIRPESRFTRMVSSVL